MKISEILKSENSVEILLNKIAGLQSTGNTNFKAGIFLSYRYHKYLPYSYSDDNIFYTASIVFNLNSVKQYVNIENQKVIEKITSAAVSNYRFYINKDGLDLYNFWRTTPEDNFMPNEYLIKNSRNKKWARKLFKLAEDIDDTALIYLTSKLEEKDLPFLQDCLTYNANLTRRVISNTLNKYKSFKAYSTWFGSAKAPIEFDVCAMSNMLKLILKSDLNLTEQDSSSLQLILKVIEDSDYLNHPHIISPFYVRTSSIIYHLGRLLSDLPDADFGKYKTKLISDIKKYSETVKNNIERVLLSITLLNLSGKSLEIKMDDYFDKQLNQFWFCIANIASFENKISFALGRFSFFHMKFKNEAHTLSLLLEHEVLKKHKEV